MLDKNTIESLKTWPLSILTTCCVACRHHVEPATAVWPPAKPCCKCGRFSKDPIPKNMFEPIPELQETFEAKVAKASELLTKDELFKLMFI